jgi:MoaA/NifB/PqqE/SkfB family radical SAM enzyme
MTEKVNELAVIISVIIFMLGFMIFIPYLVFTYSPDLSPSEKDSLASKYVKEYYPEYQNCTIEYDYYIKDSKGYNSEGALIYCDKLPENRDGMVIPRTNPTQSIIFQNVTIQQIKTYYELKP